MFSTNDAQFIQQSLDVCTTTRTTQKVDLEQIYQIKETCDFITKNNFQKIALQFPDDLLVDSDPIASEVEKGTNAKLYILGDTSYGSCCVDEVAAEHVGAQCVVHYGRSCLSPSRRLPVKHVFGKKPLDLDKCASAFRELYPDPQSHVVVLYDVMYSYAIDNLIGLLQPEYENLVTSALCVDGEDPNCHKHALGQDNDSGCPEAHSEPSGQQIVQKFGRRFILKGGLLVDDYSMFFVGQESITLTNFMMTWNKSNFCSFDPETLVARVETVNINRALMKRFYLIERAKDAAVVGILVGTLGVANYLNIIEQLKETIRKAGKKSYIFAMGKLNVPKLANFLEIDIYVLVACPENSMLDSSDFYRPVVTPFEMDVACNKHRDWTGEYVTDFRDLLPGACSHVDYQNPGGKDEEDQTDISLITGDLRSSHISCEPSDPTPCNSLVQKNQNLTLANTSTAASFLAGRSWRGLEQKLGETPVIKAVEGRRGIAIAYEEEG